MSLRNPDMNLLKEVTPYHSTPRPEDCPDVALAEKIAEHINTCPSRMFAFTARVYVSPGKTVVTVFVHEATSAEGYNVEIDKNGTVGFGPAKSIPRLAELYRIVKMVHERTEDPIVEIENARAERVERMAEAGRAGGRATMRKLTPEARAAMAERMRESRWTRVDRLAEAALKESGLDECIAKIEAVLADTVGVTDGTRQVVRKRLADRIVNRVKVEDVETETTETEATDGEVDA